MRFMIATLMAAAGLFSPLSAMAESADVEAVITNVDTASLSLSLDDGEKYQRLRSSISKGWNRA